MNFADQLRSPIPSTRFVWDPHLSVRQPIAYKAEDNKLLVEPAQTVVSAFLQHRSSHLDPPDLTFKRLGEFLGEADIRDLEDRTRPANLSHLALVDDRRDPCGLEEEQPGQPLKSNGLTRIWTSEKYATRPIEGKNRYRESLNERGLYDRLCLKVKYTNSLS
jgi:hypothetical protein